MTTTATSTGTGSGGGAVRAAAAPPTLGVPSAPALPEDLELLLRGLRLPHIRRHAPDVLATAKAQRWEPVPSRSRPNKPSRRWSGSAAGRT